MLTPQLEQYFEATQIPLRLACTTSDGWPVVLSLWYLYQQGCFYCATQSTARVVHYLQDNPRCAFEIAADQPPYCGVRGQGLATVDSTLGADILPQLLHRYLGGLDNPLAQKLLARRQDEVAIIIQPQKIFTWNYSERMRHMIGGPVQKPCPE
jgi:hypothetical protein